MNTTDGTQEFELEKSPPPGEVPERVITELMYARTVAKDHAASYGEAMKDQAEKHNVKLGALKRYVAARCDDKIEEARAEAEDFERLLDKGTEE